MPQKGPSMPGFPRAVSRKRRALSGTLSGAVMLALTVSAPVGAHAVTTDAKPSALEKADATLAKTAATAGMVLLENKDSTLPMPRTGNVALFGVGAYKTVKGGTGSGDVNNRYTITARQGLVEAGYHVTTSSAYWSAMTKAYDAKYPPGASNPFGPPVDYSSVEQLLTPASVKPTKPTSTAIYVVARNAGEGADRSSGPGDYQLTATEKADITLIGKSYLHVVVVLNVGGVVDTSFYKAVNRVAKDPKRGSAIDSLLLMSQAGQESGRALVQVLNG